MRIALFVTCLADTLFPDVGKSTTVLLERLGHRVDFPQAQTCCGQMHVNTGYQREALPLVRRYVDAFEPYDVIVAPSGSCVGSIRHQHAMVARRLGDAALARRAEAAGRAHLRAVRAAHRRAAGWRTWAPTTRTGSPTTRPATRCGCCGSATGRCGCCARCAGLRPGRAARRGCLLRVRRHVRAEERRHLDRDAGRQDAQRPRHRGRGMHRRRQLVPDAHRRRPVPAAGRGARPCTWPRSSPRPGTGAAP